jgi:hypothetical protein
MHVVGALLALLAFAPLGVGVLLLAGAWRLAAGILRAGLALFAGLATGAVALPPLLYLGLSPTLPVVLLLGALVLGAGVAVTKRRRPRSAGQPVRIGPLGLLVIGAPVVLLSVDRVLTRISTYDAFSIWMLKARLLYRDGGWFLGALDHRAFAIQSVAPPVHREYPLGVPALVAAVMHGSRGNVPDAALLYPMLLAGFAFVIWLVLRPRLPRLPLLAGLSLVLWLPETRELGLAATGDLPLGVFFVAATLLLGLWLVEETPGALPLAALLGAAALACKRDAIGDCGVLAILALIETARLRRSDLARRLGVALVLMFGSIVPWRVYVSAHHLKNYDVGIGNGHLSSNVHHLGWIVARLWDYLVNRGYLGVAPLAMGVAALALARTRQWRLPVSVLVFGVALFTALVLVYVDATAGLTYLVHHSAERTLFPLCLFSASVLPLLLVRAFGAFGQAPTGRSRSTREPWTNPSTPSSRSRLRGWRRVRSRRTGAT